MEPKWRQIGAENVPKIEVSKKCAESELDPYIITIDTLQKPHFLTPPRNQNAGLFRVVPRMPPRGCKIAPTGPKNGESGVPRHPQGCQRISQCPLKCSKKTSKIITPAPRVPRVPHRPQNTSIFDVPPTGVTPSSETFNTPLPLSATPHSLPPPLI